jgi:allophanate hydrolase subunit 1
LAGQDDINGGVVMGNAAYDLQQEAGRNIEIVVHINESLEEHRRKELVNALEDSDGIYTAEFCPLRYHLMLVQYDRERLSSQDVLNRVTDLRVKAQLIGPM